MIKIKNLGNIIVSHWSRQKQGEGQSSMMEGYKERKSKRNQQPWLIADSELRTRLTGFLPSLHPTLETGMHLIFFFCRFFNAPLPPSSTSLVCSSFIFFFFFLVSARIFAGVRVECPREASTNLISWRFKTLDSHPPMAQQDFLW